MRGRALQLEPSRRCQGLSVKASMALRCPSAEPPERLRLRLGRGCGSKRPSERSCLLGRARNRRKSEGFPE
eukprot:14678971-Alexandrium_andersonii.AAC.1